MSDCADSEYPVMIDLNLDGNLVRAPLCNALDFSDKDGTKSAAKFLEDSEQLIKQYYNKAGQRAEYAIMPRFLLSSTPAMMEACKELRVKYPEMKFHTHMSENLGTSVYSVYEFSQEADAYYGDDGIKPNPEFLKLLRTKKTKFEIWDAYDLVDEYSTWGHSIHMTESDLKLSQTSGAKHCHCPTSNLFLGSGLFDMKTHIEMDIEVGMGSDVGAGTSYEMLRVMGDMYKVAMTEGSEAASIPPGTKGEFNDWYTKNLTEIANGYPGFSGGPDYPGYKITGTGDEHTTIPYKRVYKPYPLSQIYLVTLATASVMGIDDKVGSFKPGMEADFVVTDMDFSPIYKWNKKVTEEHLTKELKAEASAELANFKMYTDSDLSHVGNDLADYLILEKELFPLIVLSDDRTTLATYIMGKQAYDRKLHYDLSLDDDYKFP
jgi:cytosine/adenosine deaminase-related metal-dependent hydrolase